MNAGDGDGSRPSAAALRAVVAVGESLCALFDIRLRSLVTPHLMPVIYAALICGLTGLDLHFAIIAFDHLHGFGLIWLLLMPVLFIAGVIAVRVCLEFILAIFRIVVDVERLVEQLHHVSGQTETIAADLPRIAFWRSRESRLGSATRKSELSNTERSEKGRN